jgi:hypothetical protein
MSRTALQMSEVQQDLKNPPEPRSGEAYPRPAKGILVAMTVMVATFASRGSSAM